MTIEEDDGRSFAVVEEGYGGVVHAGDLRKEDGCGKVVRWCDLVEAKVVLELLTEYCRLLLSGGVLNEGAGDTDHGGGFNGGWDFARWTHVVVRGVEEGEECVEEEDRVGSKEFAGGYWLWFSAMEGA